MAEQKRQTPLKPTQTEKLTLAVLKQSTQRLANQLRDLIRLFRPETVPLIGGPDKVWMLVAHTRELLCEEFLYV